MSQSRAKSFLEASLNTLSGFGVSILAGYFVFPLFGFHPSHKENFLITCIYTVISVIRSYIWRRVFNWHQHLRGNNARTNSAPAVQ